MAKAVSVRIISKTLLYQRNFWKTLSAQLSKEVPYLARLTDIKISDVLPIANIIAQ